MVLTSQLTLMLLIKEELYTFLGIRHRFIFLFAATPMLIIIVFITICFIISEIKAVLSFYFIIFPALF